MVRNCGPVSKKPQRSQTDSKVQSRPARPGAVTIPQKSSVLGGDAAQVGPLDTGRQRHAALIAFLDGLGDPEVLLGDGPVRDARVGERHAHRAVTEEGGDGFEAHAPVDHPSGEGVAELMGMDVADTGALGHPIDVAVDGASVKGLAVVALDQASRAARPPEPLVVGDQLDQIGPDRDVAVVVQLADGDPQREGIAQQGERPVVESGQLADACRSGPGSRP